MQSAEELQGDLDTRSFRVLPHQSTAVLAATRSETVNMSTNTATQPPAAFITCSLVLVPPIVMKTSARTTCSRDWRFRSRQSNMLTRSSNSCRDGRRRTKIQSTQLPPVRSVLYWE